MPLQAVHENPAFKDRVNAAAQHPPVAPKKAIRALVEAILMEMDDGRCCCSHGKCEVLGLVGSQYLGIRRTRESTRDVLLNVGLL